MEKFEIRVIDNKGIYKKTIEVESIVELEARLLNLLELIDKNRVKYTNINVYGKTGLRILEIKHGNFEWLVSNNFINQYQHIY